MRALIEANHQGDVAHVCVCGQKRPAMPRLSGSHPTRLQPPYACSWSPMWPEIVSRDRQLRSGRVLRFRLASTTPLVGSVGEELKDSKVMKRSACRCGPLGIDLWLVQSTLNACFNVDA